jgi:hypothetical protein
LGGQDCQRATVQRELCLHQVQLQVLAFPQEKVQNEGQIRTTQDYYKQCEKVSFLLLITLAAL